MRVSIPNLYSIKDREGVNTIQHVVAGGWTADATITTYKGGRAVGYRLGFQGFPDVHVLTNSAQAPADLQYVLRKPKLELDPANKDPVNLEHLGWKRYPAQPSGGAQPPDQDQLRDETISSWADVFSFRSEQQDEGIQGLREPQLGAIHKIQGHWLSSSEPGTVVMPTGTGKTETMIAALVVNQCKRLLVVVPTDALRTQIADKFLTLGILREIGVVSETARNPVVCTLRSIPRSASEVQSLFSRCNVIVTTMSVAGRAAKEVQEAMAACCSHLFIDEAHHVSAPTWRAFKEAFADSRILQFTATPYRNDNRPVEGKIIYNYSLRRAQQRGYFKPINFVGVREFHPKKRDEAIAEAAIDQLAADVSAGHDHILMARVANTRRAGEVFEIYKRFPQFNPVELHTGITSVQERDRIKRQLVEGKAKVVVCVDMLGEGFDLPELKIAAFHDVRQSLPITIQLTGRFTRARKDLGDATVVANTADVEVSEELRKLYEQDVDWNVLLPALTEEAIQEQIGFQEFVEGFQKFPEELSLATVRPSMSAVAYTTQCEEWSPANFPKGIRGFKKLGRVYADHNPRADTLVIVTAKQIPVDWTGSRDVYTWDWQLYVLHWDREQQILFINNSSNSGYFEELARAVAGDGVSRIQGPSVFRSLHGINRLRLKNVGLLEQLGRFIRYTMRSGSDVELGLSEAEKRRVKKANIFGSGFEHGSRTTAGCSYKGRLWSYRNTNIKGLVEWCQMVGRKLVNESIDPDEVLRGTLKSEFVSELPEAHPIAVDWPLLFYTEPGTRFGLEVGGRTYYRHEFELLLAEKSPDRLDFLIRTASDEVRCRLALPQQGEGVEFHIETDSSDAWIIFGSQRRALNDFFHEYPPVVWFADGSSLEGNEYTSGKSDLPPYSVDRLEVWDWSGVTITRESQRLDKEEDSIQYRVIQELKSRDYAVVFDDDDPGELADVVAIKATDDGIHVDLFHCKFSGRETPGARINDLYTVCGQAQKSVRWLERPEEMFVHLLRRKERTSGGRTGSRFEIGDEDDLFRFREMSRKMRVSLSVFVVQPGVSKARVSPQQLELLAVTENYLHETFLVSFKLICSQ